jgi:hypothetical protein
MMRRASDEVSELILACSRAARDTDHQDVRRLARDIDDWERVRDTASAHSLLPLLAARLSESAVTIPSAVMDAAGSVATTNLSRVASLLRTRALLAAEGIETIAFKGPALSVALYDDPAIRQSNDIDLLVKRREALAARRLLQAEGHRFGLDLSKGEEERFLHYSSAYVLRDEVGVAVDLAWALAPRHLALDLDADSFFPESRSLELGGVHVAVLAPHDLFLALAVHGGKHLWERLGWVADIAQLLATAPDLDVTRAIARARSIGAERLVLVAPALARLLLDAELPQALSAAVRRDPAVANIAARLAARLLPLGSSHHDRVLDPLMLTLRERPRDRAMIVARLAVTPTVEDWQWARLPDALAFAYPAVRPFRLAKKYLFS